METEVSLHLVVLNCFLPSCHLRFSTSHRWAALDDNMALISWLVRIDRSLQLKGDIVIKLLELGQKSIRLGFTLRFLFEYGLWRGRPISGAG